MAEGRFQQDYEDKREIGAGSFARVYRAISRTDRVAYAIKRVAFGKATKRTQALKEAQHWASLSAHPNIVRYHSAWSDDKYLFIQLECCEGNVADLLPTRKWSQQDFCDMLSQVAKGLHHMHSSQLSHLDVKPKNILYKYDGSLTYKLCDLGCVNIPDGDGKFLPPEFLNSREEEEGLGGFFPMADIFSLGMSIYSLAKQAANEILSVENSSFIKSSEINLPLSVFSEDFVLLLRAMMDQNPLCRPRVDQLEEILQRMISPNFSEIQQLFATVGQLNDITNFNNFNNFNNHNFNISNMNINNMNNNNSDYNFDDNNSLTLETSTSRKTVREYEEPQEEQRPWKKFRSSGEYPASSPLVMPIISSLNFWAPGTK